MTHFLNNLHHVRSKSNNWQAKCFLETKKKVPKQLSYAGGRLIIVCSNTYTI